MTVRRLGHWGTWSAVALLAAVACGGGTKSDSGASTGSGPIAFEDLPAEYARTVCRILDDCDATFSAYYPYGDDCEPYLRAMYQAVFNDAYAAAVEEGRIAYHGDLARACLNQAVTMLCDAPSSEGPEECEAMYEGLVPTGGACTRGEECQGEAFCRIDAACPGLCAPLSAADGYCDSDQHCAGGLVCAYFAGQCVAPQPLGAECNGTDLMCGENARCTADEADPAAPLRCVEYVMRYDLGEGEACAVYDGQFCGSGLRCVYDGSELGVGICSGQVATTNGPCQASYPPSCPTGQYCDVSGDPAELTGTCRSAPTTGEACAVAPPLEPECALFNQCVDGVCVEMQHTGGACQDDEQCFSYQCGNGVCTNDPCADFEPSTTE